MADYKKQACCQCRRPLTNDEIGIFRKLACRDGVNCLCLSCLAQAYGVTEEQLQEKIQLFKDLGCCLF